MKFFIVIISISMLIGVITGCSKNLSPEVEITDSINEIQFINDLFDIDLSTDCYLQNKTERFDEDTDGAFCAKVVVPKNEFEKFSPKDYIDIDDYTLDDAWSTLKEFETDEDIENLKIHKLYQKWSRENVKDIMHQTTKQIILTTTEDSYCIYFYSTIYEEL